MGVTLLIDDFFIDVVVVTGLVLTVLTGTVFFAGAGELSFIPVICSPFMTLILFPIDNNLYNINKSNDSQTCFYLQFHLLREK